MGGRHGKITAAVKIVVPAARLYAGIPAARRGQEQPRRVACEQGALRVFLTSFFDRPQETALR